MEKRQTASKHWEESVPTEGRGVPDSELVLEGGEVLAQVETADVLAHPGLKLAEDGHVSF